MVVSLAPQARWVRAYLRETSPHPCVQYRLLRYVLVLSSAERASAVPEPPSVPATPAPAMASEAPATSPEAPAMASEAPATPATTSEVPAAAPARLHNLVTGEALELDAREAAHFAELPAPYSSWMDPFIEKHFLVPVDFDEKLWVDFLRAGARVVAADAPREFGFAIMPVSFCNARCPYCYEQGIEQVAMTDDVANQTVAYIVELCRKSAAAQNFSAHITWYGGEPLLGHAIISKICTQLKQAGISWDSFILTNAYLVDEKLAARMKNLWNVKQALVTLDGTEETYNNTKAYRNPTQSPFRKVIDNIELLLQTGIRVRIRLNLDAENGKDLHDLVVQLADRFKQYDGLSVHVSIINTDCLGFCAPQTDAERLDLHQQRNELIDHIKRLGLVSSSGIVSMRVSGCLAAASRSVLINPRGELARCYRSAFGACGSVFDEPATIPPPCDEVVRTDACETCVLYPDCLKNTLCNPQCRKADIEGRIAQILGSLARL